MVTDGLTTARTREKTRLNPRVGMETTPRHKQTKPSTHYNNKREPRKNNRILRTHHNDPRPPRILTQTVRESRRSSKRTFAGVLRRSFDLSYSDRPLISS